MRWSIPLALILLLACTPPAATGGRSATPPVTAAARMTPTAVATPTATARSTAAPAPTCRLPVVQVASGQAHAAQQPGFLELPASRFEPWPAEGMYYDRPLKRWVPASPPELAADGKRYAYVSGDRRSSTLHIVELGSDNDTDRIVGTGGPWRLVGLGTDAIYLMKVEYQDSVAYGTIDISRGLWRVPLDGTSPTQLTGDSLRWTWVDDKAVYASGSTTDIAGGPSPVVRFSFQTRQVAAWFESPYFRTRLLAVDSAGAGFVISEGDNQQLWRIPATGEPVKIWSGPTDVLGPDAPVAFDGSDVWFSSSSLTPESAIYHYSPALGFQVAASFTDRHLLVAGACT